jgi:hypothetical protein
MAIREAGAEGDHGSRGAEIPSLPVVGSTSPPFGKGKIPLFGKEGLGEILGEPIRAVMDSLVKHSPITKKEERIE